MNSDEAYEYFLGTQDRAWKAQMENRCFFCKNPIPLRDLKEQLETGVLHIHYCSNCVAECNTCHELRQLYAFPYDPESKVYQRWLENNRLPYPPPPEAFAATCSHCERKMRQDAVRARLDLERARLESPANLRLREAMRTRLRAGAMPEAPTSPQPAAVDGQAAQVAGAAGEP